MWIESQEANSLTEITNNIKENLISRWTIDIEKIDYYINFILKGKFSEWKLQNLYDKISNSDDKKVNEVIDFLYFMGYMEKELNDIKSSLDKAPEKIKKAISEQAEMENKIELEEFEKFMNDNL